MKIVGINYLHSDASCSLIIDNNIVSAVEEERFVRKKHYSAFPYNSLNFCLSNSNIKISDIDFFCFNFNRFYNFNKKLKFLINYPELLKISKSRLEKEAFTTKILEDLKVPREKIKFIPHHKSHMASSYFFSGFEEAITFSFDGTGDFSTIEIFRCVKNHVEILEKINFPNSLGLFYQMVTQYLGFKKYGDEYKVMSLASFGKNNLVSKLLEIFKIDKKNRFEINLNYLNYIKCFNFDPFGDIIEFEDFYTEKFENLIGFPPRKEHEEFNENHKNLASSAQFVFSLLAINLIRKYENLSENLCLTGGCAFNSVFCQKLKEETKFKNIYIMPNSGDAGGGLGAAQYLNSQINKNFKNKIYKNTYLGPGYDDLYINNFLEENQTKELFRKNNLKFKKYIFDDLKKIAAKQLFNGEIIFWFRGRSEFGPRALGNRSILANPLIRDIKEKLNLEIKEREDFRPFAPSVIDEHKEKYFHTHKDMSNFMNFVVKAKEGTEKVIPSVIHVDNTARAQIVSKESNNDFYNLINEFGNLSNHYVLLNTSLNIQEPICNSPSDAINTFIKSNVKNLFLQNYHIFK